MLVDSHQFSVKCPKSACAPGSGCRGSGCLRLGRGVGARRCSWPWQGGLQPSLPKGDTETLRSPSWEEALQAPLDGGGCEVLGGDQHIIQRFSGDRGVFIGFFVSLVGFQWFNLFIKYLKRKQTYSIQLHVCNLLPWIRWVLSGV